jgi:hypothetical protein
LAQARFECALVVVRTIGKCALDFRARERLRIGELGGELRMRSEEPRGDARKGDFLNWF